MFAEEFAVLDPDTLFWQQARPLLNAALYLEQQDERYRWHGWQKQNITAFLQDLPAHCALVAGVWETDAEEGSEQEQLVLGLLCEVVNGEIRSLRTFESLNDPDLPAITALEPGFEHARELLRVIKRQVAPVAWAIFTDLASWQEWFYSEGSNEQECEKGEVLALLASQGRCVLLGNRAMHHHL